jgi:glycosyltransferase involved in cell wall biosynthesis
VRVAAYEDSVYRRDADGLTVTEAFPLFMFALAEELEDVTVLGRLEPGPGRAHYAVPAGARFVPLPHYGSLTDPVAVLRALAGTVRRFWAVLGAVDVLWVNGPQPMALVALAVARLRRRRVVLGVRQNTLEYARTRFPGRRAPQLAFRLLEALWRRAGRRATVVAVGPDLAGLYRGAGCARVHELTVSFVPERAIAGPEVAAARDYGGTVDVLSVGRLDPEKNPLLLADVLARLVAGGGDWRLRVVGEGSLAGALAERLTELGVAGRAELLGYVPLDRGLDELYRRSHVLLHVSWTEGVPQVLLEAFGGRLPVVATEVGGVGPVARGAAVLVPPGDADAAAAAVRRLAGDAALRDRLVGAGVERVRAHTAEAERARLAQVLRAA